ncbi:MAG: hypothetical protein WDA27_06030 [Actinomycetota bacterium]
MRTSYRALVVSALIAGSTLVVPAAANAMDSRCWPYVDAAGVAKVGVLSDAQYYTVGVCVDVGQTAYVVKVDIDQSTAGVMAEEWACTPGCTYIGNTGVIVISSGLKLDVKVLVGGNSTFQEPVGLEPGGQLTVTLPTTCVYVGGTCVPVVDPSKPMLVDTGYDLVVGPLRQPMCVSRPSPCG